MLLNLSKSQGSYLQNGDDDSAFLFVRVAVRIKLDDVFKRPVQCLVRSKPPVHYSSSSYHYVPSMVLDAFTYGLDAQYHHHKSRESYSHFCK